MEKNAFEVWSNMVVMRGPDKIKHGELIHDFYIKYAIKNYQYMKTLQEVVDVMCKVKFKPEKNNDKSTTQKQNKNEVANEINKMRRVLHKKRTTKKVILMWSRNAYIKYL